MHLSGFFHTEKPAQINKDKRTTDESNTDLPNIDSFPSDSAQSSTHETKRSEEVVRDMNVYREIIKENIGYEYLLDDFPPKSISVWQVRTILQRLFGQGF